MINSDIKYFKLNFFGLYLNLIIFLFNFFFFFFTSQNNILLEEFI
jgi:hypothetical protein